MKYTLPGIIGAAMIILAGCSSKSAVSTSGEASDAGYAAGAGAGAPGAVTVENVPVDSAVAAPVLGDIFFDFDSSALSAEAQQQLKQNASWIEKNPQVSVTIQGHCDERGTDEYNMALGERRAVAARDYLTTIGVGDSRLSTISFGEEMPFDSGHNEEAWAKNRRDHFITK
ncbi:MAG: peptidoglycan-associated lipoprotein Pal [Chlorobiaceae bacterium]|nr:peptidoglycan-associated lipoprotein Pal [Chlorobiaceae bacterium]